MSELHATYDGWRSAGAVADDGPLGDCDRCNGDLYAVAYLEPINAEVLCPACAKKLAVGALTDWPEDELDSFCVAERASVCRDCERYSCTCP